MNFNDTLRLPAGSLISGTVSIPCQGFAGGECSERVIVQIDDVDEPGQGNELDAIDFLCDETEYRCDECREAYLADCAWTESVISQNVKISPFL